MGPFIYSFDSLTEFAGVGGRLKKKVTEVISDLAFGVVTSTITKDMVLYLFYHFFIYLILSVYILWRVLKII